jgi:hypothetical protein
MQHPQGWKEPAAMSPEKPKITIRIESLIPEERLLQIIRDELQKLRKDKEK